MKKKLCYAGCALILACALIACEDDDDFNYTPQDGFGALIVDNYTDDDISIFVDGIELQETKDSSWRGYDLKPGVRRIVLDQQGGDHSYAGDIDILEGRKTIVDVYFSPDSIYLYEIRIDVD